MRRLLQLVALLTLSATMAIHAQISNPDKLVAAPPRNPALTAPRPDGDLQWLWQYVKPSPSGNKHDLLEDARFTELLSDSLKAPQAMWGTGVPLDEAARAFLGGEGEVASTDNRHLTITGCIVDHCAQRGLLYADLGERRPLVVFLALRWNEQTRTTDEPGAPFTLWVFPSRTLDPHQLPQPLKESFAAFTRGDGCKATNITNVIVVDPDGVPHILGTFEAGVMAVHCDTRPVFTTPRN